MKKLREIFCIIFVVTSIIVANGCGNQRDKNTDVEQTDSVLQDIEQIKTPEELRAEQEKQEQQKLEEQKLRKQQAIENQKKSINEEIKLLDRPDILNFCNKIENQDYLVMSMRAWAKMIREGESSDIVEIRELTKKLKIKAIAYQKKALPILRKVYAASLNKKLWIEDGKAYVSGNNNSYITIISPELLQNKKKQEAHLAIHLTLKNLRFREARYKWYDGSDYTYWTVFEGKDTDLIESRF